MMNVTDANNKSDMHSENGKTITSDFANMYL